MMGARGTAPALLLCLSTALGLFVPSAPGRAEEAPKTVDASPPAGPGDSSAPALSILEPAGGLTTRSGELELQLLVRVTPSDAVTFDVQIDGRPAQPGRGVLRAKVAATASEGETLQTLLIQVPPRDCTLSIVARTPRSSSSPASARVRWQGAPPGPSKPKLYVLAVGVSDYRSRELRLRYPAKDAGDLASTLTEQAGKLFRAVEARVLADGEATRANILDGLQWLERQTTAEDVTVLFLAGHGVNDQATGEYLYLPHDADLQALGSSTVPGSALRASLHGIAGKVLLFLDTCHAGNVLAGKLLPARIREFASELSSAEGGVVVFTSSTGRQISEESASWGNGAFTKALVEGLRGRADHRRSGRVTVNMLDLYVSERVRELTQGRQTPATAKPSTIADFPLVLLEEGLAMRPEAEGAQATPPRQTGLELFSLGADLGTPFTGDAGSSWQVRPQVAVLVRAASLRRMSLGVRLALGPTVDLASQRFSSPTGSPLEARGLAVLGGAGEAVLSLRFPRLRFFQPALEIGARVGGARVDAADGPRSLLLLGFPLRGRFSLIGGAHALALVLGLAVEWLPDTSYRYTGADGAYVREERQFGLTGTLGVAYEYRTRLGL